MKPEEKFLAPGYKEITDARWEHLRSLGLTREFCGKTVLEVGAGIGEFTKLIIEETPAMLHATDARQENLEILIEKISQDSRLIVSILNLDCAPDSPSDYTSYNYDIIFCYGLLYHLGNPGAAIAWMARHTKDKLFLESAVAYEPEKQNSINPGRENADIPSHSPTGAACRPGRKWIFSELKKHFPFVYMPYTQPNNRYFPTDWQAESWPEKLARSVFIASRKRIENPDLIEAVPMTQINIRLTYPFYTDIRR